MKKVFSIVLVALLLLNVMGYYGLFMGLKYKNTLQITQRLNAEDYNESETVTIKIPLTVPYYGDTDFERVDGEFEHEGQFYRLVKQKLERDTLHIVCIKDPAGKRIHAALTHYVKTFSDQSADRSNTRSIQSLIKDYMPASFHLIASAMGWHATLCFKDERSFLRDPAIVYPTPPPRA